MLFSSKIRHVINEYVTSVQVELQQRSVEYDTVFRKYDHLRYVFASVSYVGA